MATGSEQKQAPNPQAPKAERAATSAPVRNELSGKNYEQGSVATTPAITPYPYSAQELTALLDDTAAGKDPALRADTARRWIAWGIQCNRRYALDQVKKSNFDGLRSAATFESAALVAFPDVGPAALEGVSPRPVWLGEVVAAWLTHSPMGQDALRGDKGAAESRDDKSAALTDTFIGQLTALQSALVKHFADDSAAAIKELTVRKRLFEQFKEKHNLNVADGLGGSQDSAVADKLKGTTSCTAYPPRLLKEAFDSADKQSKAAGSSGVSIKKTTEVGWDPVKKQRTKGAKKAQYNFYDNLGVSAKDAGAWTDGGGGGRPKPGDLYILTEGKALSHIGFFKFVETTRDPNLEVWHTFDGGQIAGKVMKDSKGRLAQDGSLNNTKRIYDVGKNQLETPTEAKLAELRGQDAALASQEPAKVNQDGKKRSLVGFIDIGKLISAEPAAGDKGT